MRSNTLALALVASLGLGGAVLAAPPTTTSGVIKSIDAKAMTVVLQDGSSYTVPKGVDLKAFKVGGKVTITWDANGKKKEASALKAG